MRARGCPRGHRGLTTRHYLGLPGLGDASLSERDRERQGATPESPSDPRRWQKLARPRHWALAMNFPG